MLTMIRCFSTNIKDTKDIPQVKIKHDTQTQSEIRKCSKIDWALICRRHAIPSVRCLIFYQVEVEKIAEDHGHRWQRNRVLS